MKEKKEVKKSKFLSENKVYKHIEIFIIGFLIVGLLSIFLKTGLIGLLLYLIGFGMWWVLAKILE